MGTLSIANIHASSGEVNLLGFSRPIYHYWKLTFWSQETSFTKIYEKFGVILDQTGHIFMNEVSFMKMK